MTDPRVMIKAGIFVERSTPYSARAELLLRSAVERGEGRRGKNYHDDKSFVTPQGIESLIGAGARIVCLNSLRRGKVFYHSVIYEEHNFITASDQPLSPVIETPLIG